MFTHQLRKPVRNALASTARAEVCGEIDGARACFAPPRHPLLRRSVWQGAEDERRVAEGRAFSRDELDGVPSDARRSAALIVGRRERELELGMVENECAELATGIATRAKHPNRYSIHPECIIMRTANVNGGSDRTLSCRTRRCYRSAPWSTNPE